MQKCKNCGAELKPGVKFCTKCGTPIEANKDLESASQNISSKATVEKIKKHSLNYFSWYKDSIINPSEVNYDNKYFGLVSFLINAILVAWSVYIIGHRAISAALRVANEYASVLGGTNSDVVNMPNGLSLYLKLFFVSFLYFAVFLVVGFLCKKYLIDNNVKIFDYANQLASFSNSMIILEIIMVLVIFVAMPSNIANLDSFSDWSLVKFLIVLLVLMSNIWLVSYVASIIVDKGKMKLDRIYVAVITLILNSAVLYFVFKLMYDSLASQYSSLGWGAFKGVLG